MKILLLCNYEPYNAATVSDHINSFDQYSRHDHLVFSYLVSNGGNLPEDVSLDLFDGVVLHYSVFLAIDAYVSEKTRQRLKCYKGVKAIFLQDEYRFVDASLERIREIGFQLIFTCVPPQAIEAVYPIARLPGVCRVNVLTGYVPQALLHYQPLPLAKRKFDVSYRGRKYPAWHGRLGLEKWSIADRFRRDAKKYKLKINISYSEKDRAYGLNWVRLIQQSRAVLGAESGASVFDFTGQISARVETITSLLRKSYGDEVSDTQYQDLRRQHFEHVEDKIPLAQISPRILEAIALRTLCILYEGEYSGVLEPWRHYVPLKKDHSNMDEVARALRSPEKIAEIVSNAYAEVAINTTYSYQTFVRRFDDHIESAFCQIQEKDGLRKRATSTQDELELALNAIRKRYPFYRVSDPHGLLPSASTGYERKALTFLRDVLSPRLRQKIKSLFK